MVEVFLNIKDYGILLKWYTRIYGNADKKPSDDEIRLLSKIETMRDAEIEKEHSLKD